MVDLIDPRYKGILPEENLRHNPYTTAERNAVSAHRGTENLKHVVDPSIQNKVESKQSSQPVPGNATDSAKLTGRGRNFDRYA